jgi:hypothetical protein
VTLVVSCEYSAVFELRLLWVLAVCNVYSVCPEVVWVLAVWNVYSVCPEVAVGAYGECKVQVGTVATTSMA